MGMDTYILHGHGYIYHLKKKPHRYMGVVYFKILFQLNETTILE